MPAVIAIETLLPVMWPYSLAPQYFFLVCRVFAKSSSLYFESNLNHVGSKNLQDKKEVFKLGSRKYISLIPGMLLEGTKHMSMGQVTVNLLCLQWISIKNHCFRKKGESS